MGRVVFLLLTALLVAAPRLHAQDREPGAAGGPGAALGVGGGFGPRFAQMLTDSLHLTAEQQEQVNDILAESRSRSEALLENAAGDRETLREGMREIFQATNERIEKVLTPEQLTDYARIREQMQQRARERMRGHN